MIEGRTKCVDSTDVLNADTMQIVERWQTRKHETTIVDHYLYLSFGILERAVVPWVDGGTVCRSKDKIRLPKRSLAR